MLAELMGAYNAFEFGVAVADGICQGFTGRSIAEHIEGDDDDACEVTYVTPSYSEVRLKLLQKLDAALSPPESKNTRSAEPEDCGEEPDEQEPEEYEPEDYEPEEEY